MNEIFAYLPYNFLMSAYGLIPTLLLIDQGASPIAIGFVAAISSIGGLISSIFWPRYVKTADKKSILALGYLGIFLGSILLQDPKYVYLAAFILAFFPPATYYAVLSEIRAKYEDISQNLSKIFSYGEIANAAGYLVGAIGTMFLSPAEFALLLSFLALATLPFIAYVIGDEGILSLLEKGIKEMEIIDDKFIESFQMKHKLDKFDIAFLATAATFSLAFGLVFPQLPAIMKKWFLADYMIYTLVMIARITNAFSANIASKFKDFSLVLAYVTRITAFALLLFAIANNYKNLAFIYYMLAGISWGFQYFFYNYVALSRGEELVGANVLVRTIAYSIGSFISGFLVKSFGFYTTFLIGFIIVLFAPLWYYIGKKFLVPPEVKAL